MYTFIETTNHIGYGDYLDIDEYNSISDIIDDLYYKIDSIEQFAKRMYKNNNIEKKIITGSSYIKIVVYPYMRYIVTGLNKEEQKIIIEQLNEKIENISG